jgi:hypothetical protein
MDFQARGTDGVDVELERLATLSGRMRLLVLRRAGLRTSLRAYERAYALAAATRRLALAQATTPAGEAVYPTEAARAAAFTLVSENDLALHALGALADYARRRLELTEAELAALRGERLDCRLRLRLALRTQ